MVEVNLTENSIGIADNVFAIVRKQSSHGDDVKNFEIDIVNVKALSYEWDDTRCECCWKINAWANNGYSLVTVFADDCFYSLSEARQAFRERFHLTEAEEASITLAKIQNEWTLFREVKVGDYSMELYRKNTNIAAAVYGKDSYDVIAFWSDEPYTPFARERTIERWKQAVENISSSDDDCLKGA